MRTPIVGGNWKMNLTASTAAALADAVRSMVGQGGTRPGAAEVVLFPSFVHLGAVAQRLSGTAASRTALGAQDLWPERDGAFTGEVSASMLVDAGCDWVLAGHSERRHVVGESDDLVGRKVRRGVEAGLRVMLCVGETPAQRDAGLTEGVVCGQLALGLAGLGGMELGSIAIAYEPVWAIGTGLTATASDAQVVHALIRRRIREWHGHGASEAIRIMYGGSVKPENAAELMAQPDIDGLLVGGASLEARGFAAIVAAAG